MQKITIDMFPEGFRDIAELLGVEQAAALCEYIGGEQIYVPKIDRITTPLRHQKIYEGYMSGQSYSALARSHNLATDTVRKIVQNLQNKSKITIEDFIEKEQPDE